LQPPCEIIVKHVLPTIRAMIAKELIEKHNLTQVEAAKRLGISQAAISWYLAKKRGHADKKGYRITYIESSPEIKDLIHYISEKIASENATPTDAMTRKFCNACISLRSNDEFCQMHLSLSPSVKGCTVCLGSPR